MLGGFISDKSPIACGNTPDVYVQPHLPGTLSMQFADTGPWCWRWLLLEWALRKFNTPLTGGYCVFGVQELIFVSRLLRLC